MKLVVRLLAAFGLMVIALLAVALLGGVGTVELTIWAVVLVVVLVTVGVRARRRSSG